MWISIGIVVVLLGHAGRRRRCRSCRRRRRRVVSRSWTQDRKPPSPASSPSLQWQWSRFGSGEYCLAGLALVAGPANRGKSLSARQRAPVLPKTTTITTTGSSSVAAALSHSGPLLPPGLNSASPLSPSLSLRSGCC